MDIAFYRLQEQGLLEKKFKDPVDVVYRLGAVQAQDFAGAKWAIGLRTRGWTEPEVERVFTDGLILRTHVLRPTWHFVLPEDIRWMLALTAPRVRAQMAYVDRQLELDKTLVKKSTDLLIKSLQGGRQMTRAELEPIFQKGRIPAVGQRLGQLLIHAELDGVVCSGPRKGKQFTYALLEERVPPAQSWTRQESLVELLKRYFLTRAPATLQDFAWWSGLTLTDAREGMELVRDQFVSQTLEGQTYWHAETQPTGRMISPAAWLLPNYDEFFIGLRDRSAIGKIAEKAGIKKEDAALLNHIIILDGQVVGGWRRTLKKESVLVEASLITQLTKKEQQALGQAAAQYGDFLELSVKLEQKESLHGQRKTRSF